MLYQCEKPFEQTIEEMQAIALRLIPLTHPIAPLQDERAIDCMKCRQIIVDGYHLMVKLSYSQYDECRVECLEVVGIDFPFLPMYLVCKVGSVFLGSHELKFASILRAGRRIYVWTVAVDERGVPLKLQSPILKEYHYEDFRYSSIIKS